MASKQNNTTKTYIGAYKRYERWASDIEELSVFPSNDLATTIYILSLIQIGKSTAVINQFVSASRWLHKLAGHKDPTRSHMVRTVLDGARRSLGKPTVRKEPINTRIINQIHGSLLTKNNTLDLQGLRIMTFILLSYAGFLRYDEAIKIRREDIAFHGTYIALFLQTSKTDIYRNGHTILIARTRTKLDPFVFLHRYLIAADIKPKDECFIFRGIYVHPTTGKQQLKVMDKHISYSTIRDILLTCIQNIGLNPKAYGTHSLRAGGATAAANRGIPDRLFKVHGRWRSENSKDRYIKDSIKRRLKVSLNLGL